MLGEILAETGMSPPTTFGLQAAHRYANVMDSRGFATDLTVPGRDITSCLTCAYKGLTRKRPFLEILGRDRARPREAGPPEFPVRPALDGRRTRPHGSSRHGPATKAAAAWLAGRDRGQPGWVSRTAKTSGASYSDRRDRPVGIQRLAERLACKPPYAAFVPRFSAPSITSWIAYYVNYALYRVRGRPPSPADTGFPPEFAVRLHGWRGHIAGDGRIW